MKLRAKFQREDPRPERSPTKPQPIGTPAARNLAMAHKLAALIEDGTITDYTEAARLLGVSQPRLTHMMGLLLLAPAIQERILFGEIVPGDKLLRRVTQLAGWEEQISAVG